MGTLMETASTERRLLAFSIDSFFHFLCFLPVWIQTMGSYLKTQVLALDVNWLLIGLLFVLFYKWLFLYFLGGTVGKLIAGLRVVPAFDPSQSLGLMQSLLRVLTDSLSIFFGHALRALAFFRLDRTHVADWVAETRVMQFKPRKSYTVRRWIVALVVMFFSGTAQFQNMYRLVQKAELVDGKIVLSARTVAQK